MHLLLGLLTGLTLGGDTPPGGNRVSFNRDVRPILADRCFKCHGPDEGARKAGLRLDSYAGATAARDGGVAVAPSSAEHSLLVQRVESSDPDMMMPPPDSGLSLDDGERATLRAWIEQGAEYERHWAFVPPREPEPPVASRWARSPIDAFVEARLDEVGLTPSEPADAATLARRLFLDLTGLPPAPERVDAFRAAHATDPDTATGELVDELLASPHHGERMAQVWLDAARYADTNGFHHDNLRTIWPYRDWVIEALNSGKPYDEFVVEQLAGDLLPDATEAQRIATAFCRMHNINDEGGALDPEYRVEAVADRIETVATVFLGLTFTCARCHDHKYDPFTQEDYYSLFAYFNSVDERGVYPANFDQAKAYPARLDYSPADLDARMDAARSELSRARSEREAAAPTIAAEQAHWEDELRSRVAPSWAEATLTAATGQEGTELAIVSGTGVIAEGPHLTYDTYELSLRTNATGLDTLRLDALRDPATGKVGRAAHGNIVLSHVEAFASSVRDPSQRVELEWRWAWADFEQANGDFDAINVTRGDAKGWALAQGVEDDHTLLLFAQQAFGFEGGTEVSIKLHQRSPYPQHLLAHVGVAVGRLGADALELLPTVERDWFLLGPLQEKTYDEAFDKDHGIEAVALVAERGVDKGIRVAGKTWTHQPGFADGAVHRLNGGRSAFYLARNLFTPIARRLRLSLGSDDSIKVFLNGSELLSKKVNRGAAADQELLEVDLPAGESSLLLKIVNNGGPAGFYHRSTAIGEATPSLAALTLLPRSRLPQAAYEQHSKAWRREHSQTYRSLDERVESLLQQLSDLEREVVPVLVMEELEQPAETFVLTRGSYAVPDKDRPVTRRPPPALDLSLPAGAPANRLGFARWLVQDGHPLTARVHVNRIWQTLFGIGIVGSTEDFGQQAEWPSHPDLLDWLAVRFVESGWDQKQLIRDIVTSSTYRQSSQLREDAVAIDPAGRLLASFPRRRLAGEFVRDQALAMAGLLVDRIGGASVRPYQPAGLWREVSIGGSSNTRIFQQDAGEALYRRSLYTFWKRTSPSPQMMMFDAPTREFCVVRRGSTNTPLQMLVLWNDVQFVEAARTLALRTLAERAETRERLERLFQRATGRGPDADERALLEDTLGAFLERYRAAPADAEALLAIGEAAPPATLDADGRAELAAWTMIANTVLSLDETIVLD